MSVAARRARLGIGHALAWVAYGLAAGALTTDALGRDSAPLALALGAACAVAAAALGLDMLGIGLRAIGAGDGGARRSRGRDTPVLAPNAPRTLQIVAAIVATAALAVAGALALLDQPPHLAVCGALGFAAGAHTTAMRAQVAADPPLAPRVRPAPTLLAAAVGVALVAALALLPVLGATTATASRDGTTIVAVPAAAASLGMGIALIAAAVLQLIVIGLAAAPSRAQQAPSAAGAAEAQPAARATGAQPGRLALLAIAAAGLTALAALRPALSAIGTDDPQPAGPLALTLAIGALLGPPLAMLADRSAARAAAILATVGGVAALAAPIARSGALDWVAAAVLGVALAASVALIEHARRTGVRLANGAAALVLLAGATGAGIAALLLLQAVPLPDVVLGAALACLLASIGAWAPGPARQPVS